MKKCIALFALFALPLVLFSADAVMQNGTKIWSDRKFVINGMPESLKLTQSVPVQKCSGYAIKFPAGTRKALIAVCDGAGIQKMLQDKSLKLTPTGLGFYIGTPAKPKALYYKVLVIDEPASVLNCRPTSAGGILLAVNENVPAFEKNNGAGETAAATPAVVMPESKKLIQIAGQEYRFRPGKREFTVYVRYPDKGVNANTGLMLVSHNWGGTWKYTAPWCDLLSNRFNLICLSVDYLQSGEAKHDKVPYDHGLLQAMDCLRALYTVQQELDSKKIKFNRRRIYAAGASGGGNVTIRYPGCLDLRFDVTPMSGAAENVRFRLEDYTPENVVNVRSLCVRDDKGHIVSDSIQPLLTVETTASAKAVNAEYASGAAVPAGGRLQILAAHGSNQIAHPYEGGYTVVIGQPKLTWRDPWAHIREDWAQLFDGVAGW